MTNQNSRFAGKPWWQMPITAPWHAPEPTPYAGPGKGDYSGTCQRFACENSGAHWFNQTNGRYYCSECARTFNDVLRRQGRMAMCELHLSR